MRFYSGKSAVTSPAYTHMESFSAGQCPWAVTGEGGQILRAAVAVRAAYTDDFERKELWQRWDAQIKKPALLKFEQGG